MNMKTVLVVGATGATGKHVVQMLLDHGHNVRAVVRSKERMMGLLKPEEYNNRLSLTEAALLDLSDEQMGKLVKDCHAIVSCLGHNGINGKPKHLVTDAVKRLTSLAAVKDANVKAKKFILMGSDGVDNPNGQDDKRTFLERLVIGLVRCLVPPHRDNEAAAAYLHDLGMDGGVEWSVVRPDDLIDAPVSPYVLLVKPVKGLFGDGKATRSNVAHAMVRLIEDEKLWNEWKFQMPVLNDKPQEQKEKDL